MDLLSLPDLPVDVLVNVLNRVEGGLAAMTMATEALRSKIETLFDELARTLDADNLFYELSTYFEGGLSSMRNDEVSTKIFVRYVEERLVPFVVRAARTDTIIIWNKREKRNVPLPKTRKDVQMQFFFLMLTGVSAVAGNIFAFEMVHRTYASAGDGKTPMMYASSFSRMDMCEMVRSWGILSNFDIMLVFAEDIDIVRRALMWGTTRSARVAAFRSAFVSGRTDAMTTLVSANMDSIEDDKNELYSRAVDPEAVKLLSKWITIDDDARQMMLVSVCGTEAVDEDDERKLEDLFLWIGNAPSFRPNLSPAIEAAVKNESFQMLRFLSLRRFGAIIGFAEVDASGFLSEAGRFSVVHDRPSVAEFVYRMFPQPSVSEFLSRFAARTPGRARIAEMALTDWGARNHSVIAAYSLLPETYDLDLARVAFSPPGDEFILSIPDEDDVTIESSDVDERILIASAYFRNVDAAEATVDRILERATTKERVERANVLFGKTNVRFGADTRVTVRFNALMNEAKSRLRFIASNF